MAYQQGQEPGQEIDRLAEKDPSVRAQEAMLRMARSSQEQGHVHAAIDMYVRLLEDYPDTPAAKAAANAMVDLAQFLEQNGMPHTALEVYEKLEDYQ